MKVKLKSNEIGKAIKLCANAIDPKDSVRSNVSFVADDNKLTLSATNGLYSIKVVANGVVEEDGSAIVDGKMAYSAISKASGDCLLSTDERSMIIKTSGRTKLPNIDHELPMLKEIKGDANHVSFDALEFKNAVGKVSYAISEDESRVILTGAHIVTDGMVATFTAIDGFRLAQTAISCQGDIMKPVDIIVPSRILDAICDAVTDGTIDMFCDGNKITVKGESFIINATTLSGSYVDTARVIPTDFKTKALTRTSQLKDCIDSATVASGVNYLVKLIVSKDNISISSNSEVADFKGDVGAMVEGDDITISFNIKYLIHALNHIDTEQCELRFNQSTSPIVIVPYEKNTADLALVLPVRTFTA